MKTIRRGIFETNSSSSHSFTLSDHNSPDLKANNLHPDEDGVLYLTGGQFGWEWESYNDSATKANYCAVYVLKCNLDSWYEKLVDVLMEYTGATEINADGISFSYNDLNYSYIDHESEGILDDVFSSRDDLAKFIFDSESILYTGNDNESAPPNFYDEPGTEYKYKLVIPDVGYKYFTEMPEPNEIINSINDIITKPFILVLGKPVLIENDYGIDYYLARDKGTLYSFVNHRILNYKIDKGIAPKEAKSIDTDTRLIYLYNVDSRNCSEIYDKYVTISYEIEEVQVKKLRQSNAL